MAGPSAVLDQALRLRDQGWRGLLPVLPPGAEPARWLDGDRAEEVRKAAGKGPGRYAGDGRWAGLGDWRAFPDDEDTVARWAGWPGVNVGLRACHQGTQVAFLDADVPDPDAAGEVTGLIRRRIGPDAPVRLGRAPKALYPFRVGGPLRRRRSAVVLVGGQRCMLEVLAEGQQAVVAGVHPGTGRPYAWPLGGLEELAPEDLPLLTVEEVGGLVAQVSAALLRRGPAVGRAGSRLGRGGGGEARPVEELRARDPGLALDAARSVRNLDWSRDDWVAWAYALRGAFGDEGEELWLEFTEQSGKHTSSATAEKVWRDACLAEREGRLRSGAEAVLAVAREEGWTPPAPRLVEGPPPHFPAEELDPVEAADRLRQAIGRAVAGAVAWTEADGPPPQTAIRAPAGLGKTVAVLDALAALPGPREVWYAVPTIALALELAAKARERGLPVEVVRGREAVVGDAPLCVKHEEAGVVGRAGLPVAEILCHKRTPDGGEMLCEFHGPCRYLGQFRDPRPALRIFAHEYLFTGLPRGLPDPALIVVDEAFALRAARRTSLGLDRLTAQRAGMKVEHEAEVRDVAARVRDLLERSEDPRGAASADTFARLAELEAAVADEGLVWPSMRWAEQKRRLAGLQKSERFKLAALWRAMRDATARSGPLQRVELRRDEPTADGELRDRVHVWWCAAVKTRVAPVLLLDAGLDETIARRFFPRLRVETVAARRNAEVVQVADTTCSRNRLLSFGGAPADEQARAANRLADVRCLAEVEAPGGRDVLLVTYKPARDRLAPIPGVDVAHFGSLRGVDRYKHHDTIIVAGREQPPPAEVEGLARSLFGDDEEPLALTGAYATATRGYRLRDGTRRGVEVAVHADPRCQAILEQVRERETEQAVDRLRLVHRDRPARVLVLSNVPLDLTVDRLAGWRDLAPSRLAVAAARLDGVLPLAPGWLAGRFADLWETAEAARHEVKRTELMGQTPNRDSYLGFGPLTPAAYRLVGQRGPRPTRALVRADHPSPEAALAALVGPLAMFRREAPEGPAEADAAPVRPSPVPVSPAPATASCARCADPAEPGSDLRAVCGWLAVTPPPIPHDALPPRRAAGGSL